MNTGKFNLNKLTRREKILSVLLIGISIFFIYYYIFFLPVDQDIALFQKRYTDNLNDIKLLNQLLQDLPGVYHKYEKLIDQKGNLGYMNKDQIFKTIENLSNENKIESLDYKTESKNNLVFITLNLKSDFEKLYYFLRQLENIDILIEYNEMKINEKENNLYCELLLVFQDGDNN